MQCTVLFFAQVRDLVGLDRLTIDLDARATASDALDEVIRLHPAVSPLRERLAVAIDERYAPLHAELKHGCTVALIPPVSGG